MIPPGAFRSRHRGLDTCRDPSATGANSSSERVATDRSREKWAITSVLGASSVVLNGADSQLVRLPSDLLPVEGTITELSHFREIRKGPATISQHFAAFLEQNI